MTAPAAVASWPVLVDRLPRTRLVSIVEVGAAVLLSALAAQLSVPIPGSPVPVTGQTFAVLLTGAALGPARGATAQLFYVCIGLVGAPVFSDHAHGLHVLTGATGGYLIGFILAAALMGLGSRRGHDRHLIPEALVIVTASAIIYLCGTTWLALQLHVGASEAVSLGVAPFLFGDGLKALLAAGVLPATWRILDHFDGRWS